MQESIAGAWAGAPGLRTPSASPEREARFCGISPRLLARFLWLACEVCESETGRDTQPVMLSC
jgi:hypothetical protein